MNLKKITVFVVFLGAIALGLYMVKSSSKFEQQKESAKVNAENALSPKPSDQSLHGFSNWNEAVSEYSKKPTQDNMAKLRSIVLTENDMKTLAEKLRPIPNGIKLSTDEAKERKTLIEMLAYCSPDVAMAILGPLTNANNQTLERCSAICSIGNLGTDAAYEHVKLIDTGDNPQVIIAVATGLERNGSAKIVPLYIDFLEKAVDQPIEKRQMIVGLISSRLPKITGANPLPKFNPVKGDPQELAKAWKDWWEKQPSDFKTTIQKQREVHKKYP